MSAALLSGVRVLDLSRVMSGPFCTAMLADLGAEVIKVELPGAGEEGRHFGPYLRGHSTYFALLNRGKRSVTIDSRQKPGSELVRALASRSDVLIENFRPGVMARYGLDAPALRAENPRLIYTSISGFGPVGPLARWPAFDLVIQALSGLMSLTGSPDGAAMPAGESIADVCTGMFAAWGIAAALFEREKTGRGCHLDVAMFDSMFSMMVTALSQELFMGKTPERRGARHPVTYPVDAYPTRDGEIVLVAFSQAVFVALTDAIGMPHLRDDARFVDNASRNQHEAELRALISAWTYQRSREEALTILRAHEIPCAPLWSIAEAVHSEHTRVRSLLRIGVHGELGEIPMIAQPVRFDGEAQITERPRVPMLGEDTDRVLRDLLGLDDTEIAALRAQAVI